MLKLKTGDFRLRTRNVRLDARTDLADRIFSAGRSLLVKELDGTRFRLIGIGIAEPGEAGGLVEPPDLLDAGAEKRAKAERAMDEIRGRFGHDGVALGLTFSATRSGGKRST